MEKNNKQSGIVYVLTNPAMTGIVKIGKTTRETIGDRMRELYSTGVPVPFKCEFACKVTDTTKVEEALHLAFNPYRINPNREFFTIEPEQAIVILKLLEKPDVTSIVTSEVNQKINESTTESDKKAGDKLERQKRPPLNFIEMGIPIGSKLKYIKDNIEVEVVGEKKIKYLTDDSISLTSVTKKNFGLDYSVQPTRYWMYNGKNLTDIYDETYSTE